MNNGNEIMKKIDEKGIFLDLSIGIGLLYRIKLNSPVSIV